MFIWTIYEKPTWSSAPYVAVEWILEVRGDGVAAAVPFPHEATSIIEARALVPTGRTRQERRPSDEPAHVETWL